MLADNQFSKLTRKSIFIPYRNWLPFVHCKVEVPTLLFHENIEMFVDSSLSFRTGNVDNIRNLSNTTKTSWCSLVLILRIPLSLMQNAIRTSLKVKTLTTRKR